MAKPVLGKSVRSDWFFLGRDFAVRTVSMKTVEGSKPCSFVLEQSRQIQNLQPKQRKKMWILSFFIAKLPEKNKNIEILLRFQRWMKKTNILRVRSVLSWTSGAFDSETETVQTQTRKRLLMWLLLSATLKLMIWKMRKLKAYLRPSLTTICRNLFERTVEKRRRIRASDSLQFSAWYKLTAILRKNIRLTYRRKMSSKNPEKSCSEAKVTCSDTSTAKETNRKLLRPSTKTKRVPFF